MQMKRMMIALLTVAVLAGACDPDTDFDQLKQYPIATTALHAGLVLYEPLFDKLLYIEPGESDDVTRELMRVEDDDVLLWMQAGPSTTGEPDRMLYLLTAPKDVRDLTQTQRLHVVGPDKTHVSYDVGASFDSIAFGPDGHFAVLYFSGREISPIDNEVPGGTEESTFYNPNEIAIVQLDAAPSTSNPSAASIDIDGGLVQQVVFLQNLTIGSSNRKLAAFFADNLLKLVDLERPTQAQAKIPLTGQPGSTAIVPAEIIPLPGDATTPSRLFLRAHNTEDIFDLTLLMEDEVDFTAAMNIFDGGANPRDLEVIHDGTRNLVVTVGLSSAGSAFTVIDAETADSFTIHLDEKVDQILAREGAGGTELVAYGGQGHELYFLQVTDLYQQRGSNLERVRLSFNMGVTQALGSDRLLSQPLDSFDMVVVDLVSRDSTRLVSAFEAELGDSLLRGDRIYFSPLHGWQISSVDLTTGHPDTLYLDDLIEGIWLPAGSAYGIALHDAPSGRVTIFNSAAPTRATARVIDGLWLDSFLTETEVN